MPSSWHVRDLISSPRIKMRSRATPKHPTTTEHKQMRNPGHKYTPRGKKMLRGVYFFCSIGMKGGKEGSTRVGSGGTGGEGGAVGGAVVVLNVLFAS